MKTIADIRARREPLVARAARQRQEIAAGCKSLRGPAEVVASGLNVIDWLLRHPLVVGAAAAALVVARPRRALRLAGRGLLLWRSWQTVRGLLRGTGAAS